MKRTLCMAVLAALTSVWAYSQCTPDTVNCKDVDAPGQICPEMLADGYVGEPYNQVVTIWPPASATVNEVTVIIYKIRIDSVGNLPPGIVYTASAEEMYPGTAYCILLNGTPTQAGEYMLSISVVPYINLMGDIVELPPVVNDTTVKMTIHGSNSIENLTPEAFQVIENQPNPFSGTTRLGFVAGESAEVVLVVYNNLGIPVYREVLQAEPGRNFFRFSGEHMVPGYYIYSLLHKKKILSGKMIKTTGK